MDDPQPPGAATDPDALAPQDEIESLRREVRDKQDRLLRALAETDNVRRRAQRDREDYDRALTAARTAGGGGNVVEGVELIQREMLRVLERAGLTRYSAVGQPFDPARHEAIARVVSGEAAPDTVVHETAPGYLLHGRVLRPALVAVAAAPDEDAA